MCARNARDAGQGDTRGTASGRERRERKKKRDFAEWGQNSGSAAFQKCATGLLFCGRHDDDDDACFVCTRATCCNIRGSADDSSPRAYVTVSNLVCAASRARHCTRAPERRCTKTQRRISTITQYGFECVFHCLRRRLGRVRAVCPARIKKKRNVYNVITSHPTAR